MRIRFVYQHFWPDSPPYATMLRTIGTHLAGSGHQIGVLTGQPSYKASDRARRQDRFGTLDGVEVTRLASIPGSTRWAPLRLLQKALFPVRAALHLTLSRLRGRTDDVVVAATMPPIANGLCAMLAARLCGARFVYHMQDIYPEIGAAGGLWSERSLRHRLMLALDSAIVRRADRCIVLSGDMRDALLARGCDGRRIVVLNNVMLEEFDRSSVEQRASVTESGSTATDREQDCGGLRCVVFAGNLGRFQGLEVLLDAFIAYRDDEAANGRPLELLFLGDGIAAATLRARAAGVDGVRFIGHRPFGEAARIVASCAAGIVSIAPGVYRYAYPSKTLTYLGLGLPLLAIVEPESELARDVEADALGVVADGRSCDALCDAFHRLSRWLDSPSADCDRLRDYHARTRSTRATLAGWDALFGGLEPEGASPGARS